jgi:serine protease Do
MTRVRTFVWAAALLALWLAAGPLRADTTEEQQRIKAVEAARKWVVSLRAYKPGKKEPGIGSGVILRSDGYILTNNHVIEGARVVKVTLLGGKQYTAKVWKTAPERDLAVLKIDATSLPSAKIGNSASVKVGQTAIAIGDPLGFSNTITVGTVGGLGRNVKVRGIHYKNLIQTDAAINPGSSGGALINLKGEVIGINTLVYTGPATYRHAQGLAFAIPINDAIQLARQLLSSQPTSEGRPWLGINGEDLTAQKAQDFDIPASRGVLVLSVVSGSPAALANLQVGDALVLMDGRTILNVQDLQGMLLDHKPGDTVVFTLWRGGKKITVPVTLDVQSQ